MFDLPDDTLSVSPTEALQKLGGEHVRFIDVRSPMEFASGHAKGSENFPLETLLGREGKLSGAQQVYVICESGGRSQLAVGYLVSKGINAIDIVGGMIAWRSSGLPTE